MSVTDCPIAAMNETYQVYVDTYVHRYKEAYDSHELAGYDLHDLLMLDEETINTIVFPE